MKKVRVFSFAMAAMLAACIFFASAAMAVEATFGGQYRINAYSLNDADKTTAGVGEIAAARLRVRQNIDLKFSDQFSTHLQLNIGHINSGITPFGSFNHNVDLASNGLVTVGLRHAVMAYKFSKEATLVAGLVPVSDKFGDTLFSSAWDFSPLAVALVGDVGVDYRLAAFKLVEGNETDKTSAGVETRDDINGYLLDLGGNVGFANIGVMGLAIQTPNVVLDGYNSNTWFGIRADGGASGINWHLSVVNSNVDKSAGVPGFSSLDDASGYQVLAKVDGKAGNLGWGVLGLYTTGKKDTDGNAKGFTSVQSLYGGQGYWGKTGILNIQGTTDTGMDQNMLRTDNDGLGLTSLQAHIASPIATNFSGYLAAGWYQGSEDKIDAGTNVGTDIGTDIYAQVKYSFPNSPLALDLGIDYAMLGKAALHGNNTDRSVTAYVARLQAEF